MTDPNLMTTELYVLTLTALLQVVLYMLYAVPANLELGTSRTLAPRDTPIDPSKELSVTTARLGRAMTNSFEALILFGIAAVVLTLTERSSALTGFCAYAFLISRVLYIPAYASGAVPWRSVIWFVGFFATILMLLACLFG